MIRPSPSEAKLPDAAWEVARVIVGGATVNGFVQA